MSGSEKPKFIFVWQVWVVTGRPENKNLLVASDCFEWSPTQPMALVMSLKGHRDCCGFVKWGLLKAKNRGLLSIYPKKETAKVHRCDQEAPA